MLSFIVQINIYLGYLLISNECGAYSIIYVTIRMKMGVNYQRHSSVCPHEM